MHKNQWLNAQTWKNIVKCHGTVNPVCERLLCLKKLLQLIGWAAIHWGSTRWRLGITIRGDVYFVSSVSPKQNKTPCCRSQSSSGLQPKHLDFKWFIWTMKKKATPSTRPSSSCKSKPVTPGVMFHLSVSPHDLCFFSLCKKDSNCSHYCWEVPESKFLTFVPVCSISRYNQTVFCFAVLPEQKQFSL